MADIMNLMSICRKAGKLTLGMDEVKGSVRSGKAYIVLVTSDLAERSLSEITRVCEEYETPIYQIPETLYDVGSALGKVYGIMSVTDAGFAKAAVKRLQGTSPK
ncbi:MAG: ribosomal L7Ae/L30e/S12e/Gadd45 family protein [Oscillospiraceae bacterium]|nr:ribosomal L7Ae/L30e/S12e/Gadd45 family protein [Oscillospiraceae bacterium]